MQFLSSPLYLLLTFQRAYKSVRALAYKSILFPWLGIFLPGVGVSREFINFNEFHANILISLENIQIELSTNIQWNKEKYDEFCWYWCQPWYYPSRMFLRNRCRILFFSWLWNVRQNELKSEICLPLLLFVCLKCGSISNSILIY